ncbi:type I restriction and modification enzyme subunit R-like protein [Paraburkholderia sp. BL8N3]|nr:type I restriction endonuclease [Paraburkholderia sp. BL8N3]TCK42262.1 type I restriction and modification enzyme subunit R-like protein [Paraburkholderia sp. BL8N3]
MVDYAKPIAESNNFIVLDIYAKESKVADSYQSEGDLEREFIQDLVNQGYEHPAGLNTSEALLANVRKQLQTLNNVEFSDGEWSRFVESWLDMPSDSIVDKTRKIHDDQDRRVTTTTCAYMGLRMRKSIRGRPEPPYTKTPKNQTTPISLAPISSSILRTRRRPLTARFACQP